MVEAVKLGMGMGIPKVLHPRYETQDYFFVLVYFMYVFTIVPSAVQNLTTSFNNTHIIISWVEPQMPNGILKYSIVVEERDLVTDVTRILLMDEVTERLAVVMAELYSEYTVSVTPQTGAGSGDTTRASISTPQGSTYDSDQVLVTKN